jgi:cell wall-associated NlpC family hydrolase
VLAIVAMAVTVSACASGGAVPRPFPGAPLPPSGEEARDAEEPPQLPAVIATALTYQGVPYRNGGSDPAGFDCSGFVQYVFARHGVALPREVVQQYRAGQQVRRGDIQPGDLVFFQTVGPGASHVGIALDEDRFVHAPSSRGVVRVERYTSMYWVRRYVGARRVVVEPVRAE